MTKDSTASATVPIGLRVPEYHDLNSLIDETEMKLQGKVYVPVATRVRAFRALNPNCSILTGVENVGERQYMICNIQMGAVIFATARKAIKWDVKKGAAKDYPLETAETGAIGRALALCGFGTMMGDLDEGDQIADAPVAKNPPRGR